MDGSDLGVLVRAFGGGNGKVVDVVNLPLSNGDVSFANAYDGGGDIAVHGTVPMSLAIQIAALVDGYRVTITE